MIIDTALLKTQHYKVRIKGKVEQSIDRSSAPTLHLGVVAIEKGHPWLLSPILLTYIYLYMSSSSCRAACADIPDRLSLLLPITHRLRQVLRVTSRVLTQLLYVGSCWSSHSCTSMCGGPQEYIAYELVLASPAVYIYIYENEFYIYINICISVYFYIL